MAVSLCREWEGVEKRLVARGVDNTVRQRHDLQCLVTGRECLGVKLKEASKSRYIWGT